MPLGRPSDTDSPSAHPRKGRATHCGATRAPHSARERRRLDHCSCSGHRVAASGWFSEGRLRRPPCAPRTERRRGAGAGGKGPLPPSPPRRPAPTARSEALSRRGRTDLAEKPRRAPARLVGAPESRRRRSACVSSRGCGPGGGGGPIARTWSAAAASGDRTGACRANAWDSHTLDSILFL